MGSLVVIRGGANFTSSNPDFQFNLILRTKNEKNNRKTLSSEQNYSCHQKVHRTGHQIHRNYHLVKWLPGPPKMASRSIEITTQ